MKNLLNINILIGFLYLLPLNDLTAQSISDTTIINKEYTSLEEALINSNEVYRLNLSDQDLNIMPDSVWLKFENLEYLSLKNDHLKEIPLEIGNLKKLEVLDLSGNDFTVLPQSFSNLENLKEIYLNEEAEMDVDQSLDVIKGLGNLKILHLENDNLKTIPTGLSEFANLESLFLNNNPFNTLSGNVWSGLQNLEYLSLKDDHLKEIPFEIGNLKNLKVLDLSGNDFKVLPQSFSNLENLREIYLNDELEMDVDRSLNVIKDLSNLKILHLENDNLQTIPSSLLNLIHLESLYLNKNQFNKIPLELKRLKNLNYIDLHDNQYKLNIQELQYQDSFGLKIRI